MGRDEFDRDLDDYLKARKRALGIDFKGIFSRLMPKRERPLEPQKVELPEQVEVYEEKPETESWMKKIFNREKKEEPVNEDVIRERMRADDAVSDMKDVSKIALGMIRTLPDEQLRTFKQSTDFEKLKQILKKHDLIK